MQLWHLSCLTYPVKLCIKCRANGQTQKINVIMFYNLSKELGHCSFACESQCLLLQETSGEWFYNLQMSVTNCKIKLKTTWTILVATTPTNSISWFFMREADFRDPLMGCQFAIMLMKYKKKKKMAKTCLCLKCNKKCLHSL